MTKRDEILLRYEELKKKAPGFTKQAIATIIAKERGKTREYIGTLISRTNHKRPEATFPFNRRLWEKFRDNKIMDMTSIIVAGLCSLPIRSESIIKSYNVKRNIQGLLNGYRR